jgi:hypothetical protein
VAQRLKLRVLDMEAICIEKNRVIIDGYERDARVLCAYLSVALPTGTINAFAQLTGADPERILDVGNEVFSERGRGASVGVGGRRTD